MCAQGGSNRNAESPGSCCSRRFFLNCQKEACHHVTCRVHLAPITSQLPLQIKVSLTPLSWSLPRGWGTLSYKSGYRKTEVKDLLPSGSREPRYMLSGFVPGTCAVGKPEYMWSDHRRKTAFNISRSHCSFSPGRCIQSSFQSNPWFGFSVHDEPNWSIIGLEGNRIQKSESVARVGLKVCGGSILTDVTDQAAFQCPG